MNRRENLAAWLLRIDSLAHVLAAIVVFLPNSTIAQVHEAIGFGEFPDTSIAWYLARGLPAYYALHGGLILYMSFDVRKYVDLIRVAMRLFGLYGLLILVVDLRAPMPRSWTIAEPVFVLTFSAVVLALLASTGSNVDE